MPINIFHLYKPLRNYLRQFDRTQALVNLWRYSSHLAYETPLLPQQNIIRYGRKLPLGDLIFPWDLDILVREIVINAGSRGLTFENVDELIKAVRLLRHMDNEMSILRRETDGDNYNVIFEMHRLGNRQFPFQERPNLTTLIRHHKIHSDAGVEPIVIKETGLNLKDFFQLGLMTTGAYHNNPAFNIRQDLSVVGIDENKRDNFYNRITCTMEELKKELVASAVYDEGWLYTWNPLVQKPLLSFDPSNPSLMLCPIPSHFYNRITKGIYYDIVSSEGFDNAYGDSFQKYVGEVIHKLCPASKTYITPERQYIDGKGNLQHGVDWILTDNTAHIFIECKTKRLTLKSKTAAKPEDVKKDLDILAENIVQHYKNIIDAEQGKTDWKPDGKPILFLMVTLEYTWLFSPVLTLELESLIKSKLCAEHIDEGVIKRIPYHLSPVSEFEEWIEAMISIGFNDYFTISTQEHGQGHLSIARHEYASHKMRRDKAIFEHEIEKLMPKLHRT